MGKALDTIKKLEVVEFDWKHNDTHDISLIAEEVVKIIPEAVFYKEGKVEGLRLMPLLAIAIEAIKELKEEINAIRTN